MVLRNIVRNNIFLIGNPLAGKTAVIKQVIERMNLSASGFYTEEVRSGPSRVGFVIKTLDGREGYLAHCDIKSPCTIRKYGVDIRNIETIAVPSIVPIKKNVLVIDGIGKMECFSEVFKRAVIKALDSTNIVIGTIAPGGDDFITEVRSREDVELHEVTQNNRKLLPDFILNRLSDILMHQGEYFPSME